MSPIRLSDTDIGKCYKIVSLACKDERKDRLNALGFIHGATVKTALKSPFGKPSAYLVCGTLIALRDKEAEQIYVEVI